MVTGSASAGDHARISGNAHVREAQNLDYATVTEHCVISGQARVDGHARVAGR